MDSALTERHAKVAWAVVGLIVVLFVGYVLYSFVGALVVGVFLYYATRPVYRRLDDRFDHPDVNAAVTLLVVGLPLLLVLGYAAVVGARELDQFLASAALERLRASLAPYLDGVVPTNDRQLTDIVRSQLGRIVGLAEATFNWSLRVFVAAVVAFYLLRDDRAIARWFCRTVSDRHGAVTFMESVDNDLTTIYTGNLLTIGITGLVAAGVYYVMSLVFPHDGGLSYPLLLGLVLGVATLIPAVGMKIVYFPYTGYLLWRSLSTGTIPIWIPIAFFLITLVVIDSVPDIFIRSYVSKGDIHMGVMLLTYVLGAIAFGWYGVFFGPIVLVFFLHFARDVFPALLNRDSSSGNPE